MDGAGSRQRSTLTLQQLIELGRRHRLAGELDDAVAAFTQAHQQFPAAARPLVERGAIVILQQRYAQSRADYAAAAKLEPDYPGLSSYVAELDLYTGRAAEALQLSRDASQTEPDNLMHRINAAHALLLLGQLDAAADAYRALATTFHSVKQRTGSDLALQDLRLLADAGVQVPWVDQIRALLADA